MLKNFKSRAIRGVRVVVASTVLALPLAGCVYAPPPGPYGYAYAPGYYGPPAYGSVYVGGGYGGGYGGGWGHRGWH